jgi:protein-arginine kinase activator protein McsA
VQAEEELFSEKGPQPQKPPKVEDIDNARERIKAKKETEAKQRLDERYEKARRVREQLEKLKRPNEVEQKSEDEDDADDGLAEAA